MRELIEDGVRRILRDNLTSQSMAASSRGEWHQPLWTLLEDSGFTRALCSGSNGGSDASWSDIHPLLVASGYHCLPLPLPETLLANRVLESAGIQALDGPIGLADPLASAPLSVRKDGDGWRLSGELRHVPWGRHCKHLVAQALHQGEVFIAVLEAEGLPVECNANLAREPRDTFVLRDVRALRMAPTSLAGDNPIRLYGALLRSAQTAGAAQMALEQAVRYAGERVQFGRPLAKFQAVQQQIASAVSEVAAITAAADHACNSAEEHGAESAISIAKITAAEAAGKVAAVAHAVHGAIGFTQEHSLHHATQRLWSWRSEFGNGRWWSERLGRAVCLNGADHAWASLVDADLLVLSSMQEQS
jgi:acyl-CoA dehydrogenase